MKKCLTVLLSFIIVISCITPVMADDIYVTPENFFEYFDKEGDVAVLKENLPGTIHFSGEFRPENLGINQIKIQDNASHIFHGDGAEFYNIWFNCRQGDFIELRYLTIEIDAENISNAIYAEGGSIEVLGCVITMNRHTDGDKYVFYGKDIDNIQLESNFVTYASDYPYGNSKDVVFFIKGNDGYPGSSVFVLANSFVVTIPPKRDTTEEGEIFPSSAIIDVHKASHCEINGNASSIGTLGLDNPENTKQYFCNVSGAEPSEGERNTNELICLRNSLAAKSMDNDDGFYFLKADNFSCEVYENDVRADSSANVYGFLVSPVNSFLFCENEIVTNALKTDASTIEIKPDYDDSLDECTIKENSVVTKSDYAIDLNNMPAKVTGNALISADYTKFGDAAVKNADNATLEDNGPDYFPPVVQEITSVTLDKTEFTYNGNVQKPKVTEVKAGETVLTSDDYEVVYSNDNSTDAGTYKVTVSGKGSYCGEKVTDYKITAKKVTPSVTLSKTSYVWNGKAKKPSVTVKVGSTELTAKDYSVTYAKGRKNVGEYSVKVTLKGNYSGSKTASFKINPLGTTISKLTAGSKSVTVKWKKQTTKMSESTITGYQIQAALTKNFKTIASKKTVKGASKTSGKLTGLKTGKNYYVRIRTYKTVSGKKYYSAWSKAKTVKVS